MKAKTLTKEEEKNLNELLQEVSKTLIKTMYVLDLKTHLEMTSKCGDYTYKLRFDKSHTNKT